MKDLFYVYHFKDKECLSCADGFTKYCFFNKEIYILFKGRIQRNILSDELTHMSDEEIVAYLYCLKDKECLDDLRGLFSFIIIDNDKIFSARDQLGLLPLYYYYKDNLIILSSRMKDILNYLNKCVVDKDGIRELLALGPSVTPGKTIYKDIYSLKPAHYLYLDNTSLKQIQYYKLTIKAHTDNKEDTIKHIRELLIDSVKFNIEDLNHVSCMLSGGIDSSIICSIVSSLKDEFNTFSLEYKDQDLYFKSNEYQSTQDDYYIDLMNDTLNNIHKNIVIDEEELYDYLSNAVIARDMPGMADIDSSLYVFLKDINKYDDVVLSGECADEIFGGYPWFYKKELYEQEYFPWMRDIDNKIKLFNNNLVHLNIKDYILDSYKDTLRSDLSIIKRTILLNYWWFMQTLIIRGETISNMLGMDIRMPFASLDLLEYLYNVPDDYFFIEDKEKGLLREAFKDDLPDEVLNRKKNPFPKTYSPIYTDLLYNKLKDILKDKNSILYILFNKEALYEFVESKGESFKNPWYGQLMKGPQLLAYFIQIDFWYKTYNVQLELS